MWRRLRIPSVGISADLLKYPKPASPCVQINPDGSTNGAVYYLDRPPRKQFMVNGSYAELLYDDANRKVTGLVRDSDGAAAPAAQQISSPAAATQSPTSMPRRGVLHGVNDVLDRPKLSGGPATELVFQPST